MVYPTSLVSSSHQFDNIKWSFFVSLMKRSFPLCIMEKRFQRLEPTNAWGLSPLIGVLLGNKKGSRQQQLAGHYRVKWDENTMRVTVWRPPCAKLWPPRNPTKPDVQFDTFNLGPPCIWKKTRHLWHQMDIRTCILLAFHPSRYGKITPKVSFNTAI